jgi:fucose permease
MMSSWASRLPEIRDRAGMTSGDLGVALLVMSAGSVGMLLASGALVGALGVRRSVQLGGAMAGGGLLLIGIADAPESLLAGLLLAGAGGGLCDVAINAEASAATFAGSRRRLMSTCHGAFSVGTIIGAVVGVATAGAKVPLAIHLGGTGVLLASLLCLAGGGFSGRSRSQATTGAGPRTDWSRTLICGVVVLGAALAEGSAHDWLSITGVDGYGLTPDRAAVGLVAFVTAMTLARFALGRVHHTIRDDTVLAAGSGVVVVGVLLVCSGAAFGQILGPVATVVGLLGVAMWGVGVAPAFPLLMAAAGRNGSRPAAHVAAVSAIGYSAFLIGPPTLGQVADRAGIERALLLVPAAVIVTTAAGVVYRRRTRREPGLAEPLVDVGMKPLLDLIRRARGLDRAPRQRGQRKVLQAVHLARGVVLRGESGAEQQRVVGAECEPGAGTDQPGERHLGQRGVDTERHVARRADFQRDPGVDDAGQEVGVLAGAHAVAEPGGPEVVQRRADVVRAEQFAAVRHAGQAGLRGDPKGRGELLGHPAPLVVAQPEADHLAGPVAGMVGGESRQGAGVQRMPDTARRDDDRDLAGGGRARLAGGVQDDLQGGGDAADVRRVGRGVDLDLQPAGALGGVVGRGLEHDAAHVVAVPHARSGSVVEPLEPEPAALVRGEPQ